MWIVRAVLSAAEFVGVVALAAAATYALGVIAGVGV